MIVNFVIDKFTFLSPFIKFSPQKSQHWAEGGFKSAGLVCYDVVAKHERRLSMQEITV